MMHSVMRRRLIIWLVFGGLVAAYARPAIANSTLLDSGAAPVIVAQMRTGTLTVRTWNRPQVRVVSDGGVTSRQVPAQQIARRIPAQIPLGAPQFQTPGGVIALPPEPFVVPKLSAGAHAGVVLRGSGNAVVTIPSTSALLVARLQRGAVTINGYRNGVFVAIVRVGSVRLQNVAGIGAVQVLSGRIIALHSDFTRLQARTARGNLMFHNCNAAQIEAASVRGSIVYDNGTFNPGLAHFQSEQGNIAIGVASGGVQFGAQSASGHVYSALAQGSNFQRGGNSAQATIRGGGPVVTATSGTGSVFLYRGTLRNQPQLRAQMQQIQRRFQRKRQAQRGAIRRQVPPRRIIGHRPPTSR